MTWIKHYGKAVLCDYSKLEKAKTRTMKKQFKATLTTTSLFIKKKTNQLPFLTSTP